MGFLSPNLPAGGAIQWLDPPAAPNWHASGWYGMIAAVAAILISLGVGWWRGESPSPAAPLQQHVNGNNVQEKEARPYPLKINKNRGLLPLGFVSNATSSLGNLINVSPLARLLSPTHYYDVLYSIHKLPKSNHFVVPLLAIPTSSTAHLKFGNIYVYFGSI